jgi:hypothetical protein
MTVAGGKGWRTKHSRVGFTTGIRKVDLTSRRDYRVTMKKLASASAASSAKTKAVVSIAEVFGVTGIRERDTKSQAWKSPRRGQAGRTRAFNLVDARLVDEIRRIGGPRRSRRMRETEKASRQVAGAADAT